jgi:hypothetical protein
LKTEAQRLVSKRASFIVLTILIVVVLAEGFSGVLLHFLEPPPAKDATEPSAIEKPEALHPYLGYVMDPSLTPNVSSEGFYGGASPVRKRSPGRVLIGILGGSVAAGFSGSGGEALAALLKRDPSFAGKKIIAIPLAFQGYKEPQQLMAVSYLLAMGAEFDILINLDGFNEMVIPPDELLPKHVFPFYPRTWYWMTQNSPSPKTVAIMAKIIALTERRKAVARALSAFPLRLSPTLRLLGMVWDRYLGTAIFEQRGILLKQGTDGERYAVTGPPFKYDQESEFFQAAADVWKRCSLQLHRLAKANGIRYFHFLQPNQYLAGSKPMGSDERELAIKEDHPYRKGVELGYPYLIRAGKDLAAQGVAFRDLTGIFREIREPLYIDDCCHINGKGNELLAEAIARAILGGGAGQYKR